MNNKIKNDEKVVVPYRLNLTLNAASKKELGELMAETGKTTIVDVLRAALKIFGIIVRHQKSGGRVILRDKDNKEETLIIT